ncbi:MAG: hypothetical protein CSB55_04570 [Candidatus Cloacimonadota bacterium]|nr:MAG: hypothetical protein CSB55_04570 [Candidatus Cloacimonadota bacterium]
MRKKENTFKTRFIPVLILTMIILSCSKSNPAGNDSDGYWQQYLFEDPYNNFISNGLASDNNFYCTGKNGISIFTSFDTKPTINDFSYISAGYDSKPVISPKLTAFSRENSKTGITLANYETRKVKGLFPARFATQFAGYQFSLLTTMQELGAINNQNRFITAIKGRDSLGVPETCIVYADIDLSNDMELAELGYMKVPSMKDPMISIQDIESFGDKFYISYTSEMSPRSHYIEISENGKIREFTNHFDGSICIITFFKYQGYLCAQKSDEQLIYTSDGENWQHMAYLTPLLSDFEEIEGYLFIYLDDKIYCLGDDIAKLKLYQIPTENLAGRTISSINKFNDKLVITTSNGIFYKSFNEIMEDKELLRKIN